MSAGEVDAFEKKYGYKPAHFRVAADALAIYVNKDNPIPCLTMQQVDQIFSATRQGSGSRSIDTWGGVGLTGEWATKPIAIYGRNSLSGTYEFFRSTVLYNGDYKESVKQQPGSAEVVRNVANDKFAIGYSGLGYKTEGVRAVPLAAFYGAQCYDTTAERDLFGQISGRPLPVYLFEQRAGRAARPAARRVHQIHSLQGRPDTTRKKAGISRSAMRSASTN